MIAPLGGRRILTPALGRSWQRDAVASGGWWNDNGNISGCVAAYAPIGAADYSTSLTDLSGNGNDATEGVAPDWDVTNGWKFNGSNDYLDTGISINGGGYTVIIKFSNKVSGSYNRLCGTSLAGNSNPRFLLIVNATNDWYFMNGSSLQSNIGVGNSGVIGIAGSDGYTNGVDTEDLGSWSGTNNNTLFIGAQNNGGTPSNYADVDIQAVDIFNVTITAVQFQTVVTAMNAL